MGKEAALKLRDGSPYSDRLKDSPNAPKWVHEWEGPFFISVQESINNFFEEDGEPPIHQEPNISTNPQEHEFLFDVKLFASVRVKAPSAAEAAQRIHEKLDCASCNAGAWDDGGPIVFDATLDGEIDLIEIDGQGADSQE